MRLADRMLFVLIALMALLTAAPAAAQSEASSSSDALKSVSEDSASWELPVSLDRIRDGLAQAPVRSIFHDLYRQPDFHSEIEIRQKLDELLSILDFKTGPVAPGGLYGYEQQQRLFNPVNHPLMQPYAAFSGGELITIALENLAVKYLGGRALNAVSQAVRSHAEEAAHEEVARVIAQYCAAQPGNGIGIAICEAPLSARDR